MVILRRYPMNVAETIAVVREWFERHGRYMRGCRAAHLMGGITALPPDAPFATYRDIDMAIITNEEPKDDQDILEVSYRNLIIEAGFYRPDQYHSAQELLADPALAPHLAVDSILYDPEGLLAAVQPIVAQEYRQRRWVLARCDWEKRDALQMLDQLEHVETLNDYMFTLYMLVGSSLCGLLAVANLQVPTHRRCLANARELLRQVGRTELHDALLDLLGHAKMSRQEVEAWWESVGAMFDRAVAVKRSPSPLGFKLHAHIRPYLIEGVGELIEGGQHREAMWVLALVYFACNAAIQNDGTADEKPYYQAQYHKILGSLATDTLAGRQTRALRARRLADQIFVVADELVACNPLVMS
jgi:hypothetical protein